MTNIWCWISTAYLLPLTLMPQQYKLSVPIYIFGIQIHKSYVAKGSHIAQRCWGSSFFLRRLTPSLVCFQSEAYRNGLMTRPGGLDPPKVAPGTLWKFFGTKQAVWRCQPAAISRKNLKMPKNVCRGRQKRLPFAQILSEWATKLRGKNLGRSVASFQRRALCYAHNLK